MYKSRIDLNQCSTQVYQNGIISFDDDAFDVFRISYSNFAYSASIAPFYSSVDTRGTGNVFSRQTKDSYLLTRATNEIQLSFLSSTNVSIKNLLIVTWDAVGYYSNHTDKVCMYEYMHIRTHVLRDMYGYCT